MSQFYEMYFTPTQTIGPMGSTPAFKNIAGHGIGTAYGNSYSYAQSASAVAQVRMGSIADSSFNAPGTLDCDERCKYLPALEAEDCSRVCGVLRY